ncbi:MAG TPA: AMP-binding protein [Actinomycetota bacterium]|nr:AMP-binding protein [Actinomycetota bacterium]
MTAAPVASPRSWAGEPLEGHDPVSLPRFLLEHARDLGDKPALVDGPTGRTLSYRQLAAGVERVAAGLAARGFGHGDVLAVSSPNLPEYALAVYGAMAAGGAVTGANPLLTADELAGQLADSGASVLVTVPPFLQTAREAAARAGVRELMVFGEADGATPFASLLGTGEPPPAVAIDPIRDLAVLPYSSGTTGLPKGVELTHANLVANVRQTQAALGFTPDDVVVAVAPFFHAIGLNLILPCSLRAGATVVTMSRFDFAGFLEIVQGHRATCTVVVPPVVLALASHPLVDRYDLSSLRFLGCGGAPLGADVEQRCAERLGCLVAQGFGMTEGSATFAIAPLEAPRPGSVGRLLPGTEGRIVDPEHGTDLGPGRTGELWLRGPQVMRGYRHNAEATAATVDGDGWLHTGDLCYVDADGYLFVVDRLKELIKYKGYQVPPAELEHLLTAHPAVADAAVVPRPDPQAGEVPVAHIALRGEATAEELLAWVAERVAPYKRLRAVRFTDQVPRSPSGKLLRRVLVETERAAAAGN